MKYLNEVVEQTMIILLIITKDSIKIEIIIYNLFMDAIF